MGEQFQKKLEADWGSWQTRLPEPRLTHCRRALFIGSAKEMRLVQWMREHGHRVILPWVDYGHGKAVVGPLPPRPVIPRPDDKERDRVATLGWQAPYPLQPWQLLPKPLRGYHLHEGCAPNALRIDCDGVEITGEIVSHDGSQYPRSRLVVVTLRAGDRTVVSPPTGAGRVATWLPHGARALTRRYRKGLLEDGTRVTGSMQPEPSEPST